MTIRFGTHADADLLATLSRTTFFETFAPLNSEENMKKFMGEQFTHEKLKQELLDGQGIFLIAEEAGIAVGYARLRESTEIDDFKGIPSIEIARIYSTGFMIGKGVGSALMKSCLEVAQQNQKKIVWLGVWEHNSRAIAFYQKWGFKIFGSHPFILGNDVQTDLLMKKDL